MQSGDEKDATKKRIDCAKASVVLECEVIELGKLICMGAVEFFKSSSIVENWCK